MTKEKLQWKFEFGFDSGMIATTTNNKYHISSNSNGKFYYILSPIEISESFNSLHNAIEFCEVHYSHIHDTKLFEDYLLGG